MNQIKHDSDGPIIEFVTLIRGGNDGVLAIINFDGVSKYFEINGVRSLLKQHQSPSQQRELQKAIDAIESIDNFDDIIEFEGGLPVQGSLF